MAIRLWWVCSLCLATAWAFLSVGSAKLKSGMQLCFMFALYNAASQESRASETSQHKLKTVSLNCRGSQLADWCKEAAFFLLFLLCQKSTLSLWCLAQLWGIWGLISLEPLSFVFTYCTGRSAHANAQHDFRRGSSSAELEELENQKAKFYWEFIWIFFLLVKSRVAESTL